MVEKNKDFFEDPYLKAIIEIIRNNYMLKKRFNAILQLNAKRRQIVLNTLLREMVFSSAPLWIIKTISSFYNKDIARNVLRLIKEE